MPGVPELIHPFRIRFPLETWPSMFGRQRLQQAMHAASVLLLLLSIFRRDGRPPPACAIHLVGDFRCLMTRSRPVLLWSHVPSLVWGILTEALPWPCPLTLLENWLEGRSGVEPYQGGFLLHYLDKLVYPDISDEVLTVAGVIVCFANLAFYARQVWISWHAHS